MKNIYYYIIALIGITFLTACEKDNLEAPASDFTGRIVYRGEAINMQYGQVNFEVWQKGFGNYAPLAVNVAQDGLFSAKLFDGDYKLVFAANQGPFLWKKNAAGTQDSIDVNINGSKIMDIEVMPYYMIRDATFTASAGKVNGFCKLEKIITDANARNVERVSLYIGKTQFVDGSNNLGAGAVQDLSGAAIADLNNLNMSVTVPTITPAQNYVFARIGVKIAGVDDMIFTPVNKISF